LRDSNANPKYKNNGIPKNWGMFLGSQHFGGVEGRVKAPRWDYKELTSFTYSHGPAQNQHKVISA